MIYLLTTAQSGFEAAQRDPTHGFEDASAALRGGLFEAERRRVVSSPILGLPPSPPLHVSLAQGPFLAPSAPAHAAPSPVLGCVPLLDPA